MAKTKLMEPLPPLPDLETIIFEIDDDSHQLTCPRCGAKTHLGYRGMQNYNNGELNVVMTYSCHNSNCRDPKFRTDEITQTITYSLKMVKNIVTYLKKI